MFAENLRLIRLARGLSQTALARAAGTPGGQQYVGRLERGLRPSNPAHADMLARALGVDVQMLTGKRLLRLPQLPDRQTTEPAAVDLR